MDVRAAFVRLRDGLRSRLPIEGGTVAEIDHVVAYDHDHPEQGGTTTPSGLESLGRRGHHLKTDGVLTVTGDANAALTFRTRTGHEYVSWPEDWRDETDEHPMTGGSGKGEGLGEDEDPDALRPTG